MLASSSSVVNLLFCCCYMPFCPGRCTSSCAVFVVFAPLWVVASLVAFLFHQMQNTMHICHHRTLPPLCRSQCSLARHPLTAGILFLLLFLLLPPPPHPTVAGCCVLGIWGWISWISSLPLGSSLSSSLSPHPPQQKRVGQRGVREEEGLVVIALVSTQHHHCVVEGHAKQAMGCFHGCHC